MKGHLRKNHLKNTNTGGNQKCLTGYAKPQQKQGGNIRRKVQTNQERRITQPEIGVDAQLTKKKKTDGKDNYPH